MQGIALMSGSAREQAVINCFMLQKIGNGKRESLDSARVRQKIHMDREALCDKVLCGEQPSEAVNRLLPQILESSWSVELSQQCTFVLGFSVLLHLGL